VQLQPGRDEQEQADANAHQPAQLQPAGKLGGVADWRSAVLMVLVLLSQSIPRGSKTRPWACAPSPTFVMLLACASVCQSLSVCWNL
jgi:hypothetical protein